jgi:hypothetical protein
MKFPFALGGGVAASAPAFLRTVTRAAGRRAVPCRARDVESVGSPDSSGAIRRRSCDGLPAPHLSSHHAFCWPMQSHDIRAGAGDTASGFELGWTTFPLGDQARRAGHHQRSLASILSVLILTGKL